MKRQWDNTTIATLIRYTRDASVYATSTPELVGHILTRIAHAIEGCPSCQRGLMSALDYSDDEVTKGEADRVPSGGSRDVH